MKLGDVKGLMIDKKYIKHPRSGKLYTTPGFTGRNQAIDQMSTRQIGLNREKLALELYAHCTDRRAAGILEKFIIQDFNKCEVKGKYYAMADAIIAAESEIIEVKEDGK